MQPEFYVFCYSRDELPEKLFFTYQLLPKKQRKKIAERRKWKRFLCKRDEIEICGRLGEKLTLPYTGRQWKILEKSKAMEKLAVLIEKEHITEAVAEGDLADYLPAGRVIDGKQIQKILLKQWMDFLIHKHQIIKKEMRVLIFDGGDEDTSRILESIYEDVNYMTICTERKEYFEQLSEEAYDQTGLMVEILSRETAKAIHADIIIDFENNEKRVYRLYPIKSIVIDIGSNLQKTEYIRVKRPDIRYYDKLFLKQNTKIFSDDVVQAAIIESQDAVTEQGFGYYQKELTEYGFQICDNQQAAIEKITELPYKNG